jgi:hypothetical protein
LILIVSFNPGGDLFCQTNVYKMFGYFSLIGLLKLHTLTSDYYMALKTIECIDLDVNKQVNSFLYFDFYRRNPFTFRVMSVKYSIVL